jgi:phage terminase small subunit
MNDRQKAFADYYIETGNATESAKRAGYSEKTAYSMGNRMLKNVEVSTYIAERTAPTEQKRIATGDEVMEFLTAVMRGEIKDAFDLPPSLADRKDAAKELAKRTVDIEARKANTDIIQNMKTVADILLNAVPNRSIEDYE